MQKERQNDRKGKKDLNLPRVDPALQSKGVQGVQLIDRSRFFFFGLLACGCQGEVTELLGGENRSVDGMEMFNMTHASKGAQNAPFLRHLILEVQKRSFPKTGVGQT